MHEFCRPHHLAAKHLGQALVAQAHPQDRQLRPQLLEHLQADPGLVGVAGAGGDQDCVRGQVPDLLQGEGVIALHPKIGGNRVVRRQLPQVLHQVEGEAVVVVEHKQHGVPYASGALTWSPFKGRAGQPGAESAGAGR